MLDSWTCDLLIARLHRTLSKIMQIISSISKTVLKLFSDWNENWLMIDDKK